jgi:hypothetical protein
VPSSSLVLGVGAGVRELGEPCGDGAG